MFESPIRNAARALLTLSVIVGATYAPVPPPRQTHAGFAAAATAADAPRIVLAQAGCSSRARCR